MRQRCVIGTEHISSIKVFGPQTCGSGHDRLPIDRTLYWLRHRHSSMGAPVGIEQPLQISTTPPQMQQGPVPAPLAFWWRPASGSVVEACVLSDRF